MSITGSVRFVLPKGGEMLPFAGEPLCQSERGLEKKLKLHVLGELGRGVPAVAGKVHPVPVKKVGR